MLANKWSRNPPKIPSAACTTTTLVAATNLNICNEYKFGIDGLRSFPASIFSSLTYRQRIFFNPNYRLDSVSIETLSFKVFVNFSRRTSAITPTIPKTKTNQSIIFSFYFTVMFYFTVIQFIEEEMQIAKYYL